MTGPAYAVHDEGVFQIDGDAKVNTCGTAFPNDTASCTGEDWDSLYSCVSGGGLGCSKTTANGAAAISTLVVDPAPQSIFTGGGSKDEQDITQWRWKDGSVPDKDDLVEAFAALYTPSFGALSGKKVIYFGANRLAVNGDAQIGFWFFQKSVATKTGGTFQDGSGNAATHTVGDILILSNFVQGGGSANIQVYVVNTINTGTTSITCPTGSVETSAGANQLCLTELVNSTAGTNGVCNTALAGGLPDGSDLLADVACAATNGSTIDALDPDFTAKGGTLGKYPPVDFFEGGLNLTDLNLGSECFPTFAVETRSSQSITAVLKDFTLGAFENCSANITTEIHALSDNSDNSVGTSGGITGPVSPGSAFHDLAIVTGTAGAPAPTGTVTFDRYFSASAAPDCKTGTGITKVSETANLSTSVSGCPTGAVCAVTTTTTGTGISVTSASPGYYSYQATYNGDSNYATAVASLCEPIQVSKFNSSIATHIYTIDSAGALVTDKTDSFIDLNTALWVSVKDQAIVTKNPAPITGETPPTPTGTVTFTRYQYSNCTGSTSTEQVTLGTCLVSGSNATGSASACSSAFPVGPPGTSTNTTSTPTVGYKVSYGGDANYNASSSSRCEPVCAIDTAQ